METRNRHHAAQPTPATGPRRPLPPFKAKPRPVTLATVAPGALAVLAALLAIGGAL